MEARTNRNAIEGRLRYEDGVVGWFFEVPEGVVAGWESVQDWFVGAADGEGFYVCGGGGVGLYRDAEVSLADFGVWGEAGPRIAGEGAGVCAQPGGWR